MITTEQVKRIADATVCVITKVPTEPNRERTSVGSGVLVAHNERNWLVTASHVLPKVGVATITNQILSTNIDFAHFGHLIRRDYSNDLAVLPLDMEISEMPLDAANCFPTHEPEGLPQIWIAGYPAGVSLTFPIIAPNVSQPIFKPTFPCTEMFGSVLTCSTATASFVVADGFSGGFSGAGAFLIDRDAVKLVGIFGREVMGSEPLSPSMNVANQEIQSRFPIVSMVGRYDALQKLLDSKYPPMP